VQLRPGTSYGDSFQSLREPANTFSSLRAAGCGNGSVLIWDFDTRGVAKELKAEGETTLVSSVGWSKDGRRLVSAALDKRVSLWDVASGTRLAVYQSEHIILRVALHPKASSLCLAVPQQGPPLLLEGFGVLGFRCHLLPNQDETAPVPGQGVPGKGKGGEGQALSFGAAAFNKRGDLVFVGTTRGEVLVVETATRKVLGKMHVPGDCLFLNLRCSMQSTITCWEM
jgi:COMPASS component SWD1